MGGGSVEALVQLGRYLISADEILAANFSIERAI
jgi:hypothetical protein